MHPAGLKSLIRKTSSLIAREAPKAAVAAGIAPNQHNAAGVDGIALEATELHAPLAHQLLEGHSNRI